MVNEMPMGLTSNGALVSAGGTGAVSASSVLGACTCGSTAGGECPVHGYFAWPSTVTPTVEPWRLPYLDRIEPPLPSPRERGQGREIAELRKLLENLAGTRAAPEAAPEPEKARPKRKPVPLKRFQRIDMDPAPEDV